MADVARVSGFPARVTVPAPVWDDSGTLIGVSIESPKRMGGQDCLFTVSFALKPIDYAHEATIAAKATVAMDAVRYEVQSKVRPVKAKQEAA